MTKEEINAVALAFTSKTSNAVDVEQFVDDYENNVKRIKDMLDKRPKPKTRIINQSDIIG